MFRQPVESVLEYIVLKPVLFLLLLGSSLAFSTGSFCQDIKETGPDPLPLPPPVPQAQDRPMPGTIMLKVDGTDLARHIYTVHEIIPVSPEISAHGGDMMIRYPMWIPGDHSPTGPVTQLAGLSVHADNRNIPWIRDTVDVSTFHIPITAGTKMILVDFQTLTPVSSDVGRVVMTPDMLNVQWNAVCLYPAGYFTRDITVSPTLVLPHGWQYGSSLRPRDGGNTGNNITFQNVSFDRLVDSPVFAGRYFRRFDLTPPNGPPVSLDVVADSPNLLAAAPEQINAHRNLVLQANAVFGSHHYEHYDFLLALTEELGRIGLEHHQSSENSGPRGYFTKWKDTFPARDLLPHEFTHSWNGKFRRPEDLWAADFNTPHRGSLLWIYEGQTQYWGYVLAARSNLMTQPQVLDALALVAATYDGRAGRLWRPLVDTTNDPVIARRTPLSWRSWQRSEDYYSEGELLWLEADTLIRELSHGHHSLDDVARQFFGISNGSMVTHTYRREDVIAALNTVQPYDWTGFLHDRVDVVPPHAPLAGLVRGGYRLVYGTEPTAYQSAKEKMLKMHDYSFSLGFTVDQKGKLLNVEWNSPAWQAAITMDEKIVAVHNMTFDADLLSDAITAAASPGAASIELLIQSGDRYRNVSIPYHGGLRYPRLERIPNTPDMLADILKPRPVTP